MKRMSLRRYISIVVAVICFTQFGLGQNNISSQWVEYPSGDDTVKAYLASPEGDGSFPALIIIHEWWGLNDWVKGNADEFARRGYVALAVDLYRGHVATSSDEAHELSRGLPDDRATKDLKSAFAFLQQNSKVNKDKIGTIGWCMGGGYSLVAALNIKKLAAAVVCYGRLVTEKEEIEKISCPILGIFGEADKGIPAVSAKAFERTAQSLDKNVRVTVYPKVGHAFMNSGNKNGYDKETADRAWEKIYAFLDSKLASKTK